MSYMQRTSELDLRSLLDLVKREMQVENFKIQIGKILKYDASKNLAEVEIVFLAKDELKDTTFPYSKLTTVPVFFLYGGNSKITFPVKAGDECIVLFNDVDLSEWWADGSTDKEPPSPRRNDPSDGIALVGIKNNTNSVAVALDAVTLDAADVKLDMKNNDRSLYDILIEKNEILSKISDSLKSIDSQMPSIISTISATLTGGIATVSGGAGTFNVPFAAPSWSPVESIASDVANNETSIGLLLKE